MNMSEHCSGKIEPFWSISQFWWNCDVTLLDCLAHKMVFFSFPLGLLEQCQPYLFFHCAVISRSSDKLRYSWVYSISPESWPSLRHITCILWMCFVIRKFNTYSKIKSCQCESRNRQEKIINNNLKLLNAICGFIIGMMQNKLNNYINTIIDITLLSMNKWKYCELSSMNIDKKRTTFSLSPGTKLSPKKKNISKMHDHFIFLQCGPPHGDIATR